MISRATPQRSNQETVNEIDLSEFKNTPVIKRIRNKRVLARDETPAGVVEESEKPNVGEPVSEKELKSTASDPKEEEKPKPKRGRKCKYATEEERIEARRKQQREYRKRKKEELDLLKKLLAEKQNESKPTKPEVIKPEVNDSDSL